ncbi:MULTISPECIES: hypothetical protein [unclassified Frankia]
MDRRVRDLRICHLPAVCDLATPVPSGVVVSVAWRLEGAGRIIGGMVPRGRPGAGPQGKRVLHGEGIWAAEMYPRDREISAEADLVEPGSAARPVRLVVHGSDRDIIGYLDQPRLPATRLARLTTGLRRDARQVRVRAAGRVWWIRATNVFGVQVVRDPEVRIYRTRGLHAVFSAEADHLDVSVVLLTLASIPSSAYAPILGF